MKELKARSRDLQVQRPIKASLSLPLVRPVERMTTAIEALQPVQEQPQRLKMGRQRLAAQAQRINQLSAQLEAAMLELKEIANDIKGAQRSPQASREPIKSICEYSVAVVPCVRHKKNGAFVLTTRPVDLFRAEREATQVAQALRRRAKKKRSCVSLPQRHK